MRTVWSLNWVRWLPAILWMAVIFFASSTPASQIHNFGTVDLLVKKGGHFLAYAILGVTYLFAMHEHRPSRWFAAILLSIAYATSDELHQIFTAGRHPSPIDVGIDALGACAGTFVYWLKAPKRAY